MELVSMKCPQCFGKVVPVGDGSYGKCLYCDSVYELGEGGGSVPEELCDDAADSAGGGAFDPESWFGTWINSAQASGCKETYFGASLPGKREDNARTYFNIDAGERVFLANDTTIFGSGKKGLACCTTGIYLNDEDNNKRYIPWGSFKKCNVHMEYNPDKLCIDGNGFITQDKQVLHGMLTDIQRQL